MPLDGDRSEIRWVFTSANGKYQVGQFDGTHFTPETDLRQVDFGRNYYAMQTFSDIPPSDGRRIQIAWMRDGKYPGMPFNGQMSFPAELTLKTTPDGPRLFRMPVREIAELQGHATKFANVDLIEGTNPLADIKGDLFHIVADLQVGHATRIGFKIRGQSIVYSTADHTLTALGRSPLQLDNGNLRLEILVDRTSIETFANGGRISFTNCYLPKDEGPPLELFTEGGSAKIVSLSVFELKSAWPAAEPRTK
jgi:fructan beta-fructosidase